MEETLIYKGRNPRAAHCLEVWKAKKNLKRRNTDGRVSQGRNLGCSGIKGTSQTYGVKRDHRASQP